MTVVQALSRFFRDCSLAYHHRAPRSLFKGATRRRTRPNMKLPNLRHVLAADCPLVRKPVGNVGCGAVYPELAAKRTAT